MSYVNIGPCLAFFNNFVRALQDEVLDLGTHEVIRCGDGCAGDGCEGFVKQKKNREKTAYVEHCFQEMVVPIAKNLQKMEPVVVKEYAQAFAKM